MSNQVAHASEGGEGGSEGGKLSLSIQTREEITAHQVAILLNVVQTMRAVALSGTPEENSPLKESQIAAESTLIHTCERLQAIVDEKARWSLEQHRETHDAIVAAHKKQAELLQANLDLVEMHKRPSFILKPTIAVYANRYFLAFFGKLEEDGMAIIGRGRTPSEALLDFDLAFNRTPAQQFRIISEYQDAPPPEPPAETPEDFRKQNPPQNES